MNLSCPPSCAGQRTRSWTFPWRMKFVHRVAQVLTIYDKCKSQERSRRRARSTRNCPIGGAYGNLAKANLPQAAREGSALPKKPNTQGKTRTREHVLEDLSVNHVEKWIFRTGFSVERIFRDFGLDLLMTTYNERGEVEPGRVVFQVKATDRLRVLNDGKTVSFPVERQHLKQWLRENDPVILVVYDGARDRAFWLYVQAYFHGTTTVELFTAPQQATVRIPLTNRLNRRAIQKFREFRGRIYDQIRREVHHDV
jgi:hypothetical protein